MKALYRLFAIHGVAGTLKLLMAKFIGMAFYFTPARRRSRALLRERDLEFDRRWGVDTAGMIIPAASDVVGSSWAQGSRYQGCNANEVERVLNALAIDFRDFTFVDVGSGKGRIVLAASRFPFKKVIGIEYSKQLSEIAERNVAIFPATEKQCTDVELACADATEFPLPQGPLVLFLYNPFGKGIMEQFASNVATSFQQEQRRIIVIYFHALFADVWKSFPFMTEIQGTKEISVYDSKDALLSTAGIAA